MRSKTANDTAVTPKWEYPLPKNGLRNWAVNEEREEPLTGDELRSTWRSIPDKLLVPIFSQTHYKLPTVITLQCHFVM